MSLLTNNRFHTLDPSQPHLQHTYTHISSSPMSPTAFILGAGGHIGLAVANKLKQEGYQVAVGARKPLQKEGLVPITVDVSDTDSITNAFAEVKQKLGAAPSVVIFNGSSIRVRPPPNWDHTHWLSFPFSVATVAVPKVPGDPATVELSAVKTAAEITVGLFASIQQAVAGFRSLPADSSVPKTFIFTGNRVPFLPRSAPWSDLFTLGLQKTDGAYLTEIFHTAYEKEGFRYVSLYHRVDLDGLAYQTVCIGFTLVTRTSQTVPPPAPTGAKPLMLPRIGTPSRGRRGVVGI